MWAMECPSRRFASWNLYFMKTTKAAFSMSSLPQLLGQQDRPEAHLAWLSWVPSSPILAGATIVHTRRGELAQGSAHLSRNSSTLGAALSAVLSSCLSSTLRPNLWRTLIISCRHGAAEPRYDAAGEPRLMGHRKIASVYGDVALRNELREDSW